MTPPARPSLGELADGQLDAYDVQILARTADLFDRLDPVPTGLVDRVQFGITLDALHAEVAELQRSNDLVGVRADDVTETQTITFTSATLTTMVTITRTTADRVRIDGWLAPGEPAEVELRLVGGSQRTAADEDGRFVFEDVPRGIAAFVLRPPAGSDRQNVVTPSIEL
jgi:hypothetical protein